jgi:hypothetical protein
MVLPERHDREWEENDIGPNRIGLAGMNKEKTAPKDRAAQ